MSQRTKMTSRAEEVGAQDSLVAVVLLRERPGAEGPRRISEKVPRARRAGPGNAFIGEGPLEVLKIGPRSVPLDADYLTGENVLEKHAQRKYTKPLYLQSGIAGDCVFKQRGYGPGFVHAFISPQNALLSHRKGLVPTY